MLRTLLAGELTEVLLDEIDKRFGRMPGIKIILSAPEAVVPRADDAENAALQQTAAEAGIGSVRLARVSRDELYHDVLDVSALTGLYCLMVALSTLVAGIGLLRGNVAIIIGAMVIAPLLGPNVGLSLATALGDKPLGLRALRTKLAGLGIALGISVIWGALYPIDPIGPEVMARTAVGIDDVVLALASGTAGALAFTAGLSSTLIGVMVAVALLPPLVTFGLLLSSAHLGLAAGAFLLLLTNIICVNLSGVVVFWIQGIRPRGWRASTRAKRIRQTAAVLWVALLATVVALILLGR
jgi:uncharacterized hydrophobic protein (TIGR00341 family)